MKKYTRNTLQAVDFVLFEEERRIDHPWLLSPAKNRLSATCARNCEGHRNDILEHNHTEHVYTVPARMEHIRIDAFTACFRLYG